MMSRPLRAAQLLASSPQEWFGRPLREVHPADHARFLAAKRAAKRLLHGDG